MASTLGVTRTLLSFDRYIDRETSTFIVMSPQVPGFVIMGNDLDEIQANENYIRV